MSSIPNRADKLAVRVNTKDSCFSSQLSSLRHSIGHTVIIALSAFYWYSTVELFLVSFVHPPFAFLYFTAWSRHKDDTLCFFTTSVQLKMSNPQHSSGCGLRGAAGVRL